LLLGKKKKSMKIAIDCRLWKQGGVGRYLRNLIFYLQKLDKKNQYTLIFYKNPFFVKTNNFTIKTTRAKWHSLAEQWQFYLELQKGSYDLVHFPYFSHPILYNRPFVITIHDLTIKHFATGKATTKTLSVYLFKRWGYLQVLNHALKTAQHILVPSNFVKKDLLKNSKLSSGKITVAYEGLGEELRGAKPKRVELPFTRFLLYVGNFYPHKNIDLLVNSLATLKNLDLNLVLVGPNDYFAQRLQRQIKKPGLTNRILFRFAVKEAELAWLYQKASALVLPSFFEGFGLPIVEAGYFGCPLLLSDIGVFREIAPKNALFFSPHSQTDLSQKIRQVIETKQIAPKSSYFQQFSFKEMAKKTLDVYNQFNR